MKRYALLSILAVLLMGMSPVIAQPTAAYMFNMPASKIPSGVTNTDIDTMTWDVKLPFTVDLDATTYDNATKATAIAAIGAATKTYLLNTWFAAQAVDTADISIVAVIIKNIDRRWDTFDHPDPIQQYIVAEDIYRVTGVVKYNVE